MEDRAVLFNNYKKFYKEGLNLIKNNQFAKAREKLLKASDSLMQLAAISDAASSGRLVPSATIVKPITLSLIFNALAMMVALSMSMFAP